MGFLFIDFKKCRNKVVLVFNMTHKAFYGLTRTSSLQHRVACGLYASHTKQYKDSRAPKNIKITLKRSLIFLHVHNSFAFRVFALVYQWASWNISYGCYQGFSCLMQVNERNSLFKVWKEKEDRVICKYIISLDWVNK